MTKVAEDPHHSEQCVLPRATQSSAWTVLFGDISETNLATCFRQPLRLADTGKSARGARKLSEVCLRRHQMIVNAGD
jgi:hypothetical protein